MVTGRRKAITIARTRTDGTARCDQCGTTRPWTRERARQHADQRRHTVRYLIEDITVYTPTDTEE